MKLVGSCQCGKVTFTVDSETPVPFMFCFCSICRKTGGAAFGCNIMAIRKTLRLKGKRQLRSYHARIREKGKPARTSEAERWFCGDCGSHLYLTDDRWPAGIWPNVSAIDTPLPPTTEHVFLMLRSKASWVADPDRVLAKAARFSRYPDVSIAAWHEARGWPVTVRP